MRIFKNVSLLFATLMAVSSFAHQIELCLIPLSEIVLPSVKPYVGTLQHMFVRIGDKGLNFEPVDPNNIMDSQAQIGKQNYASADCEVIFSTDSAEEFETKSKLFIDAYQSVANNSRYKISNNNCQTVSKSVLTTLGYAVPERLQKKLDEQQMCCIQ